jgi:hypothetical protein
LFDVQIADRYLTPTLNNGLPLAANDSVAVASGSAASTLSVLTNDTFSGTVSNGLAIIAVGQPARGSVTILAGGSGLSYTPTVNRAGLDTFTYTISDGFGRTSTATVSVRVLTTVAATAFNYESQPNTLSVRFADEVADGSYGLADLVIESLSGQPAISPEGYRYDVATRTATFTLPAGIANGDYRATFAARDVLGSSTSLDFFVLAGDADRDRRVNFADLVILARNYGRSSGMTYADGDFDDDGDVDFADLVMLARSYNVTLAPSPLEVAPSQLVASRGRPRKTGAPLTP